MYALLQLFPTKFRNPNVPVYIRARLSLLNSDVNAHLCRFPSLEESRLHEHFNVVGLQVSPQLRGRLPALRIDLRVDKLAQPTLRRLRVHLREVLPNFGERRCRRLARLRVPLGMLTVDVPFQVVRAASDERAFRTFDSATLPKVDGLGTAKISERSFGVTPFVSRTWVTLKLASFTGISSLKTVFLARYFIFWHF